jgi:hypothetical protein
MMPPDGDWVYAGTYLKTLCPAPFTPIRIYHVTELPTRPVEFPHAHWGSGCPSFRCYLDPRNGIWVWGPDFREWQAWYAQVALGGGR